MSDAIAAAEIMEGMTIEAATNNSSNNKGTFKRDALRANEATIQKEWEVSSVFASDATTENDEHFLVTFPYPYMNGVLHIGHAFSLTKAVFRAQYERHQGKNVLFPFAFHCTGMPIQAVSIDCSQFYLAACF